ncbi:ATP synthase subunit b', chloroplastic [Phoenix dactylifera]|uniref:ATP synthase subunit b', chloroplastic n=1 Tax=Phoenix dactylifera TaxID=42345 RepID=A0A8B7CDN3_PHODC|nr:ATP synthase subunit b', chloroplastic [Phoenix dactylifera]
MASTVMASSSSSATCQFLCNGRRTGHPSTIPLIPKVVVMAAKSDSRRTATTNKTSFHRRLLDSLPQKAGAIVAAAAVAASPLPALAEQMEKASLFDFNLTLPAIAVEFLLLMVALDKLYFTPLGKFMDERDAAIRRKLGDVKDTSGEVKQLEEQAAAVMRAARAEISAALNKMKKETSAELEQKLAEGRKRVEAELAEALQNLEKQKEQTIKALDSQIAALSDEIVKKVLPTA